jgi:hypothetical protein
MGGKDRLKRSCGEARVGSEWPLENPAMSSVLREVKALARDDRAVAAAVI